MSGPEIVALGAWAAVAADNLRRLIASRDGRGLARWGAGTIAVASTLGGVVVLEGMLGRWDAPPGIALLGAVAAASGAACHLAARAALGARWTSRIAATDAAALATDGPYACVRHPLYLAIAVLIAGSVAVHPSLATMWTALCVLAALARKADAEERAWRAAAPDAYARYAAATPRWLPRASRVAGAWTDALDALGRRANPTRRRYVLLLGAALWSGWLIALARPGMLDFGGEVKGADFIQFYVSAQLVAEGRAGALYDLGVRRPLEEAIIGRPTPNPIPSFVPPFASLLYLPLAPLPYLAAFGVWTLASLGVLCIAVRVVGGGAAALPWVLSFPPVFAAVGYGQNALLSTALLAAAYAGLARGADAWAGVALGLLLYKPQLAAFTAICLLLDRRWRAVLAAAAVGVALAVVSWLLSPTATRDYWALRHVLPMLPGSPGFPTWNMHSVPSFFVLLFPDHLPAARVAGWCGALGVLWLVRRWQPAFAPATLPRWFALAVWGTVLASPHLLIYDVSPLVLVALLGWPERQTERWYGALALSWPVLLFSGPLARWLGDHGGAALQLSTIAIAAVGAAVLAPSAREAPSHRRH